MRGSLRARKDQDEGKSIDRGAGEAKRRDVANLWTSRVVSSSWLHMEKKKTLKRSASSGKKGDIHRDGEECNMLTLRRTKGESRTRETLYAYKARINKLYTMGLEKDCKESLA